MWRLSVVILVAALGVECAPHNANGLIQRLKRSPHCPPEFPPGHPPPPPPPPPPPQPPQFRPQHHHSFGGFSETNRQAVQSQQLTEKQGQNYQDFGGQDSQGFGGQGSQGFGGQDSPCDTCKGQSSSISNAQSGTGNAVAIAISKG